MQFCHDGESGKRECRKRQRYNEKGKRGGGEREREREESKQSWIL